MCLFVFDCICLFVDVVCACVICVFLCLCLVLHWLALLNMGWLSSAWLRLFVIGFARIYDVLLGVACFV